MRAFALYRSRWPWMMMNGVIALLCIFLPNSIALLTDYVTVVEDRPIISVKYCLPVPVFHFRPKLMYPAARSLCDSWASCLKKERKHNIIINQCTVISAVIYKNNCRVGPKQKFWIRHNQILSIRRISEKGSDSESSHIPREELLNTNKPCIWLRILTDKKLKQCKMVTVLYRSYPPPRDLPPKPPP